MIMTKMKLNSVRLSFVLMLLLATCSLFAQEFTGHVTDPTGAVIPKVAVTAHNVSTGEDFKVVTNASGSYTIPYLHSGAYTVSADLKGFKKDVREGVTLQVDQTAVVNFVLQVGSEDVTVTVNADTVLDLGKADVGETVENARVTELPLNGRDPLMLSTLAAGVNFSAPWGYTRPFDDNGGNISINGGGAGNLEMLLDGTPNNDSPINITGGSTEGVAKTAYTTPVDSVQEFRVITSPYDAQYGMMSGGVTDVILKSGTNQIHGDVYEFARRTWLDANSWANDYNIKTRQAQGLAPSSWASYATPEMKWDQYGFEADGPLVLPKVYNGKNKSFFTVQWEHFHSLAPLTDNADVPDADWRNGDFSNLDRANGTSVYVPRYIFDPNTSTLDTTGSTSATNGDWVRTQFDGTSIANAHAAGNIMPANRVDAFAKQVLSYYPKCYKTGTSNITGAKSDTNCNIITNGDHWKSNHTLSTFGVDTYNNILLKWDEHFSDKDRFNLRYGYWMRNTTYSSNGLPAPLTTGEVPIVARVHTFATEEVHTFSPNLLLDFKANVVVRDDINRGGAYYDPSKLGWSASEIKSLGPAGNNEFPMTYFGGQNCQYWGCDYTSVGSGGNTNTIKNSMSLLPELTWIKGSHSVRVGVDARFWQNGYNTLGGGSTTYTDNTWSQAVANNPNGVVNNTGNDYASYIQGVATNASNQIWPQTYQTQHYWGLFFQDDWKVTKKLTLNLGLRWDLMPATVERHNKGNYAFDFNTPDPSLAGVSIPTTTAYGSQYDLHAGPLRGGPTFTGVNGNPRGDYATQHFNYQPRFGFAYSLNDKTVLRGGFGKSMQTAQNGAPVNGFSASYTGVTSCTTNCVSAAGNTVASVQSGVFPNLTNQFENMFWGGLNGTVLQPSGSTLGIETNLGQGMSYIDPNLKNPSFWSYSLGFERQLAKNSSVNVSYVGSRLYDGRSSTNMNPKNGTLYASCNPLSGGDPKNCNGGNNTVANPFKGIAAFTGSGVNTNGTTDTLSLSRPMPQWGDVTQNDLFDSRTWYNSLQITALHKFSNTLTLHGTETWSKSMAAGTWQDQNYGTRKRNIDTGDMSHRVTLSGVFILPLGRGHLLLPNANRIVDTAIGGWELSGMFTYQSGTPQGLPGIILHPNQTKLKRHTDKSTNYIRVFVPFAERLVQNNSGAFVATPWYSTDPTVYGKGSNFSYSYDGPFLTTPLYLDNPSYAPALSDANWTGIRTAGLRQFDTSFSKNFAVWKNLKLQIRIDAFNVLNHPEWTGGADTSTGTDQNLGDINRGPAGPSSNPRTTQLSAKFVW